GRLGGGILRTDGRSHQREREDERDANGLSHTQLLLMSAPTAERARSTAAPSRGESTPTSICPRETAESYSGGRRRNSPHVTPTVATVDTIAPAIVSSKITMRFGHQAVIAMPPVGSGQSVSVKRVSHTPNSSPARPPSDAIVHMVVDLCICPNSKCSIG